MGNLTTGEIAIQMGQARPTSEFNGPQSKGLDSLLLNEEGGALGRWVSIVISYLTPDMASTDVVTKYKYKYTRQIQMRQ